MTYCSVPDEKDLKYSCARHRVGGKVRYRQSGTTKCRKHTDYEPWVRFASRKDSDRRSAVSIYEAVAINGDKILAVGANADVLRLANGRTTCIDLRGATVIPGLIDSHHHFMNRASAHFPLSIRLDQYSSVAQILDAVAAKAREIGPDKLIFSNAGNAAGARRRAHATTLAELDDVTPDNPLILWFEDGLHVNTRMIERAGVAKNTPCHHPTARLAMTGELAH
ncbi:MAG: amidohydrolase family protein [Blastocatellia bacterium]